jgi:hypothetical protein
MDISDTLAPKSDQLDAVDLWEGPGTFTVVSVSKTGGEQPVSVTLAEFPRVWRPNKSMRRVLAACWGKDASLWGGRRLRLFCDRSVRFGNETVGGVRISHLSHITGAQHIPLIVSRGKSATYTVQELRETPAERVAALRAEWKSADPDRRKVIESEVAALTPVGADRDDVGRGGPPTDVPPSPPEQLPDPSDGDDPWTGVES